MQRDQGAQRPTVEPVTEGGTELDARGGALAAAAGVTPASTGDNGALLF